MDSMENQPTKSPLVSIGMPVYNGENFIRKCLDSLLLQTFSNFELIISDNCSSDATSDICAGYLKKDKRIRYVRQKQNIGAWNNFKHVLREAQGVFFLWAAVDDIWEPRFLEKNLDVLLKNNKFVTSMSKVNFYELEKNNLQNLDSKTRDILKKLRSLKSTEIFSIQGDYEDKTREFLKKSSMKIIYGVHRTDILRKCIIENQFVGIDHAIILNLLRYGDINVVDDSLFTSYAGGFSKHGYLSLSKQMNGTFLGMVFPCLPLTSWSIRNLGLMLFFKNIDYFVQLNLWAEFSLLVDVFRILVKKFMS